MGISKVLTKDSLFGTYEKTRMGIASYPNTKKVTDPKYLLASEGGPVYWDPDISGVSPVYNGNSAICGDLCTVVACPISHKVYLVSFEFDSDRCARATFSRLNDDDLTVGKYNPRLSCEWKLSKGKYVPVPLQWSFSYNSPMPNIDGISCCPVMAYPELGSDIFFVWGNQHSYLVDPVNKAVIADIDFQNYSGIVGGARAFKFTPYYPQMLVSGVTTVSDVLTNMMFVVDLDADAAGITVAAAISHYDSTGTALWSPTIEEFDTSAGLGDTLPYPSNYIPTEDGWEWEQFFPLNGLSPYLSTVYYDPRGSIYYVYKDYPGNGADRYRKEYEYPANNPIFIEVTQAMWSTSYYDASTYTSYSWSKYFTAYTKNCYSMSGPSTLYSNKLDIYDTYFVPCDRTVKYKYTGPDDRDNERTSPPNRPYVPWLFNENLMVPIGTLAGSSYTGRYAQKAIGKMPTVGGPQMDVCQPLTALEPSGKPLVGMYSADGEYMFARVDSYGTTGSSRSISLHSPYGTGQIIFGMAPLYDPPASSPPHPLS